MKNTTKRLLTINRHYIPVPFIRLSGKRLYKAGFMSGPVVEVEEKDDCLIIRKTPNSQRVEAMPENLALNED